MPLVKGEISYCELCSAPLKSGATRLGCLNCLLLGGPNDSHPETRRFQHYEICLREDKVTLHELGRGAMGITYRARDVNLDSPVALKIISARHSGNPEARERFQREARATAQLRHANVASVFHFGETAAGQCFYAMELVEGETLEALVRRDGPLRVHTALEMAVQVTRALIAAAAHGLIHRDLKPGNIMLTRRSDDNAADFEIKVIDFGLAKAVVDRDNEMDLTHGGFVGTPSFASPEQVFGTPADARSDIYSLGATLWYALTGEAPFEGHTVEEIRHCQTELPLPVEKLTARKLPRPVIDLLRRILSLNPAQRPVSARELMVGLDSCRVRLGLIPAPWSRRRQIARKVAVLFGLILAAAAIATWRAARQPLPPRAAPEKSIAVLPFENLAPGQENAFFADGMHDNVLTALAKVADLRVISRTSVMPYREKAARNLKQIGAELGVASVLEGTVQRVGQRVLVNAQLIDTASDRHIWAERYDLTLADSITLQGELASEIAQALHATLSPDEKARVQSKPTNNPEAYLAYLRGREAQLQPDVSRESYLRAIELYKQAVALDPTFALARARLSYMLNALSASFAPPDQWQARTAEACAHAEEALRLDPDCAAAHVARAHCAKYSTGKDAEKDWDIVHRELAAALRLSPNDAPLLMDAAEVEEQLGWEEEAIANYRRASELSPRDPNAIFSYAFVLYGNDREKEARAAFDRALLLAPNSAYFRLERARAELAWSGDVARAGAILATIPGGQDRDGRVTGAFITLALLERDFTKALNLLQKCSLEALPNATSYGLGGPEPKKYSEGIIRLFSGDRAGAYECFDSIRWQYEKAARDLPNKRYPHAKLARVYAWMGWKEPALAEAAREKELEEKGRLPRKLRWTLDRAMTYAWVGAADLAFSEINEAFSLVQGDYTSNIFRLDPVWDPLRKDQRFQRLEPIPKPL